MTVLIGIAAYFAFAVFVGRFLSLSTRGTVLLAGPVAPLYTPAVTENLAPEQRKERIERAPVEHPLEAEEVVR
jgi:hypothetical protein